MSKSATAGEKPIRNAPWAPRILFAIALSGGVLTEGCITTKYPECGFYFGRESAQTCESVRCKLKEARVKYTGLEGEEKAAWTTLNAKIAAGRECRKEVAEFNSIHGEMGRISKRLDGYRELEVKIKQGDAEESEIQQAFGEVAGILGKILEFEQALLQISRNN